MAGSGRLVSNRRHQINLVNTPHAQVALRVSQDGGLAIEHTDVNTRQARVCFATDERIIKNNEALRNAGSAHYLGKMMDGQDAPRYLEIAGARLFQVQMVNENGAPYSNKSNNCDIVAGRIMGGGFEREVKTTPRIPGAMARAIAKVSRRFSTTTPEWQLSNQAAFRIAQYAYTYSTTQTGDAARLALAAATAVLTDPQITAGNRPRVVRYEQSHTMLTSCNSAKILAVPISVIATVSFRHVRISASTNGPIRCLERRSTPRRSLDSRSRLEYWRR